MALSVMETPIYSLPGGHVQRVASSTPTGEPPTARPDARNFVRSLFTSSINLRADPARNELLIQIHGQSSLIQDTALDALCHQLDQTEVTYPGAICASFTAQ
ncbi:MAG: hypothetical protein Fur0032_17290 [Terrimicrobiaceae bacterium]